jgi:hypothetical protein
MNMAEVGVKYSRHEFETYLTVFRTIYNSYEIDDFRTQDQSRHFDRCGQLDSLGRVPLAAACANPKALASQGGGVLVACSERVSGSSFARRVRLFSTLNEGMSWAEY